MRGKVNKATGLIPIKYITKWKDEAQMLRHCEHIISHSERYVAERVFEAQTLLDNSKKK